MKNLLQNKSLVSNVNTEVLSDSTSFQSTQQNDEQNKDAESPEVACILAMIQKSSTGKYINSNFFLFTLFLLE